MKRRAKSERDKEKMILGWDSRQKAIRRALASDTDETHVAVRVNRAMRRGIPAAHRADERPPFTIVRR